MAGIELDESSYDYQHSLDQAGPSDVQEFSNMQHYSSGALPTMEPPVTRRVNVSQSPFLHAFYCYHPLRLTIDTGAETNMMRASLARHIGAKVTKSSKNALQANGRTPLTAVGETRLPIEGVVNMGHVEPPSARGVSLSTPVTNSNCFKPSLTNLRPYVCSVDHKI